MNQIDIEYQKLINNVLSNGVSTSSRNGDIKTLLTPVPIITENFPIISLRKQFWKSIVIELLWLLRGNSDLSFLQKHGVKFWDPWALEDNSLGRAYSPQFRDYWTTVISEDQLFNMFKQLKEIPDSRRIMLNIWHGAELAEMAIPPCCFAHQVRILNNKLHMIVFQRSCDVMVGLPQNIATYGLLQNIYAKVSGYEVGSYHHVISDAHIYLNQVEAANSMVNMPTSAKSSLPFVKLENEIFDDMNTFLNFIDNDVDNLSTEEILSIFKLENYDPKPYFKVNVSV